MPRTKKQLEQIRNKTMSEILDSALDLFASNGFRETTIQDIAKKAKISKGLIYNYFRTKEEILETIFKQKLTFAEDIIKKISNIDDPHERISQLIDAEIEEVKTKEKLYRLFYAGALLPKNTKKVKELCEKFRDKIGKIHQNLSDVLLGDKKSLPNKKNELLLLRACLIGIMVGYLMNPKEFDLEALKSTFKEKIKDH